MLQQDPHGARQAAEERKTPLLRILVLWIRQRKYRKCREKVELKQRTAVLISVEDRRDSRVCWGLVAHWGHTLCVSCLLWSLRCPLLFYLAHPSSCFSLEGLRAGAEHFWKIVPLWSTPFLQLSGMQTNKGKAKGKQDFHHTDPLYTWLWAWPGLFGVEPSLRQMLNTKSQGKHCCKGSSSSYSQRQKEAEFPVFPSRKQWLLL